MSIYSEFNHCISSGHRGHRWKAAKGSFVSVFVETRFVMFMSACIFELKCFCGPLYGAFVPPDAALIELHVLNLDAVHLSEMAAGTF